MGLSVYTGAFIAEIVRGSIQALPRGQGEAASALGLSAYQRLTLVILPQALRTMIPPLTNQYLNLTKNSSLAIVVGYSELFFVSNVVINNAGHAVPMFILVILTYQTMSLTISAAMNYLNARVQLVGL
jgi:general L-amino acid transport system permease protein